MTQRLQLGPFQQGYGQGGQQYVNSRATGSGSPQQGYGRYSQQNVYNRAAVPWPGQQGYGRYGQQNVYNSSTAYGPYQQGYSYGSSVRDTVMSRMGAGRYQANSGPSQQNYARQGQKGRQPGRYNVSASATAYQQGYGQFGQQYGYNQQTSGYQMGGYSGSVRDGIMSQMGAGRYQPSAGPLQQEYGQYGQQNVYNLSAGQGPSQQGYGQNIYNQQALSYQQGGYGGNVRDSIMSRMGTGRFQANSGNSGQEYSPQDKNSRRGQQYGYNIAPGAAPYQQGYEQLGQQYDDNRSAGYVPYGLGYDDYSQQQKSYNGSVRDALMLKMGVGRYQGPFQPQQQPYDDNQAMQGKPFLGNFAEPWERNYDELPQTQRGRALGGSGTTVDITELGPESPSQNPQGLSPVDPESF